MALDFITASNQYITGSGFTGYNGNYTWAIRFRYIVGSGYQIGARNYDGGNNVMHTIRGGMDGTYHKYYVTDQNGVVVTITSIINTCDGEIHTIVVTHDTSHNMEMFVDGISQGTDTGGSVGIKLDTLEAWVGKQQASPHTYERPMTEVFSDVRIYTRVWSLAEAKIFHFANGNDNITNDLYLHWRMNEKPDGQAAAGAGVIIDISGNGNHGTPVNNPVYQVAPVRLVRANTFVFTRTPWKFEKEFTETLVLADTFSRTWSIYRTFTESITLTDTIRKKISKIFTETIVLSDTITKKVSKIFTETLTLSDTLRKRIGKTFTETITLTDTVSKKIAKLFTETLHLQDTFSRIWHIYRTFIETLTLADTLRKKVGKTFIESLTLADVLIKKAIRQRANLLQALEADAMFPSGVVRNLQHGAEADLSALSPVRGDWYIAIDTQKVYACFLDGDWTQIYP